MKEATIEAKIDLTEEQKSRIFSLVGEKAGEMGEYMGLEEDDKVKSVHAQWRTRVIVEIFTQNFKDIKEKTVEIRDGWEKAIFVIGIQPKGAEECKRRVAGRKKEVNYESGW